MSKTKDDLMKRGEHLKEYNPTPEAKREVITGLMDDLIHQLGGHFLLIAPENTGAEHIRIQYFNIFEYRTNEAWDMVWSVSLPQVQWYRHSLHGHYEKGFEYVDPTFKSTNLEQALRQAIAYVKNIKTLGFDLYKKDAQADKPTSGLEG